MLISSQISYFDLMESDKAGLLKHPTEHSGAFAFKDRSRFDQVKKRSRKPSTASRAGRLWLLSHTA